MSAKRKILKNVGSNSLGYVVNVVVAFLLTPYVVEKLDETGYGVWNLVVCFVGYYGLLDVGIRSAVGHYVATYHAQRDEERVNRTLSTAMALLLVVAALAAAVTWFAGDRLPDWFRSINQMRLAAGEEPLDTSGALADPDRLRTVVWVMGAGFALSFPMALYGTVIYSVQRIGIQNAIGITQLLVRAALTVVVLERGHGLLGLACVAVGCNALGWIASIVAAYRVLPTLSIAFHRVVRASAKELFSYGGFNVLVNVGDTVLLYTSGFIIVQALHDFETVTYYAVPATTLIPYFMQMIQSVTWSFTPHFTGRWAVGAIDDVRQLLRTGTRWVTLIAATIAGGLIFLGRDFLSIWMEEEFVSSELFAVSAQVLAVLAVATLIRATQSTGRQALFAMREVRYLGFLVLIEAVMNVALSYWLVRSMGLIGVGIATLIPVALMQGFVQPRHLLRELDIDWRMYVGDVLRSALPVLVIMGAIDRLLGDALAVHSLATFVLRGTVVSLPAVLGGLWCASTKTERDGLVRRLRGG
ncbi:MAG: polysaccharide biosynthesis protein [Planctomycetes bacterium]|nr:polysaccharide biosynthesis protein [Planctomycetota bacterium]